MVHSPNRPLRIAFFGSPAFAVASLLALRAAPAHFEVVLVVTQPDRPAGRGRLPKSPEVKQAAEQHGLRCVQWTKLRDGEAERTLVALRLDAIVVAAYGRILPPAILRAARLGCLNVHASLLPAWRGASPVARALWQGDATTGVSIMAMDEGLDTGAVYARAAINISELDTCATLTERLATSGANLLVSSVPAIAAGTLKAVAQPAEGVSLAPPLTKADGALHFSGSAAALARQVRALSPWPRTFFYFGPERVAVDAARAERGEPAAPPGTVVAAGRDGLVVACGQGTLHITLVQPAGRKQMTAATWIAGRGPKKGATLLAHAS